MNRILVTATFLTALCVGPGGAAAATDLASAPLPGGEGGLVCACTNLTDKTIVVDFTLQVPAGSTNCWGESIAPGRPGSCETALTSIRICRVSRDDGKSASAKQLACSWSAVDANGNPTAVVPVDKKVK
jgi:hypothetical protein